MRASVRSEVEVIAHRIANSVYRLKIGASVREAVAGARRGSGVGGPSVEGAVRTVLNSVDARLAEHERTVGRLASDAAMAALLDVTPTISTMVREEVARALELAVPPVVTVTLPARAPVTLAVDAHEKLPDLLVALHARCHV